MPDFDFVPQSPFARRDPLGPASVNRLQMNAEAIDDMARVEHFNDGQHNALEIPWLLGHIDDGATPTGYLFDTAYGGGTLARPATGRYTVSAISGVVPSNQFGDLLYSAMANVSDSAIEAKPHTITVEPTSDVLWTLRVRQLTSALGAGDSWADQNRDVDFGLHAPPQTGDESVLLSRLQKVQRNTLTEQPTDWNALVRNQALNQKAALVEHTSTGVHNANRIAKGVGWFSYAPTAYASVFDDGVASVTRISQGVIEVVMDENFSSTNTMACFPEVQPSTPEELVIINGRGFATGAGTSAFRFYIYAFDGANWGRADRSFFAAMFGVIT